MPPVKLVYTGQNGDNDLDARIAPPGNGRTVTGLPAYLANNATFNVADFGATTNGADAIAGFNDAATVAAAVGGTVRVRGPCAYTINSTFQLPAGVSLWIDPGASIRAGAAMAAVVQTPLSTISRYCSVGGGGTIDANNLADVGLDLRYFSDYAITGLTIRRARLRYLRLGDPTAPTTSFGARVHNVFCLRDRTDGALLAGSIGIHLEYAADNKLSDCTVVGAETGYRFDTDQNHAVNCHGWAYADTGWMVTTFDDNGNGNEWTACYADTPQAYGWRLRKFNTRITGGKVYNNSIYGTDNVVIGIKFDQAAPFACIAGVAFTGSGASHRIAQDASATSLTSVTLLGSQWNNVTTRTPQRTGSSFEIGGNFTVSGNTFLLGSATVSGAATFGAGTSLSAAAADANRRVFLRTNGALRAAFGLDTAAESGGNAGAGVLLNVYDDAGTFLFTVFSADRATGGLQIAQGVTVGSGGTKVKQVAVYTPTLTPSSVAAQSVAEQTFTVSGLSINDKVFVCPPAIGNATGIAGARVSATDTLAVRFVNPTTGALTPTSGAYTVIAIRS